MRYSIYKIFVIFGLFSICIDLNAISLWNKASEKMSLFTDKVVKRKKHDLVTILIIEESSASRKAKTEVEKKSSLIAKILKFFTFDFADKDTDNINDSNLPSLNYESTKEHSADSKTEGEGKFKATITAEIIDVLPNGNLVIEARKDIKINSEVQTITLTGVIRPQDIDANNTVLSTKIANPRIEYTGKGPVSDSQKRGLLTRLLDAIWIF